jgi:hypothetical protein
VYSAGLPASDFDRDQQLEQEGCHLAQARPYADEILLRHAHLIHVSDTFHASTFDCVAARLILPTDQSSISADRRPAR